MLVDSATIYVRSGKGGDGCVSFRREKYVPKGGPDGGDGGDGGSVILIADPQVATLLDFAGKHHWRADNGQPGTSRKMHGRGADDLIIRLPPGTLIHDNDTGQLIVDMDHPGKQFVVAKGGKGGRGNVHFATPTHQTPREAEPGEQPEEFNLRLELKLVADVGLVGKPNAGKSTLLSRLSKARPKIADYPFTTLEPQLGIAELDPDRRLVIADIPGLIENAHAGTGLGTRFLRHIERTRVLVHMIEAEPADGTDPVANYRAIRHELAEYSPELAAKPEIVALSKVDLLTDEPDAETTAQRVAAELGVPVLAVSGAAGTGLRQLLEACWELLGQLSEPEQGGWR